MQQYQADPYAWWLNITGFEQTVTYQSARAGIISMLTSWMLNDSNVTFIDCLGGVPGGFSTDYAASETANGVGAMLLNAWLAAQVVVSANLTNFVGFTMDQEGIATGYEPVGGPENQTFQNTHSYDRSEQATDTYQSFLRLMHDEATTNASWIAFDAAMNASYGVDHFLWTTTYAGVTIQAGLGGEAESRAMDVLTEDVVNTVPYDQYMPMLYYDNDFPPDLAQYRPVHAHGKS